ncbi:MAG: class I SAM-dependent methyltransferase [Kiritimatiellia bacterium]
MIEERLWNAPSPRGALPEEDGVVLMPLKARAEDLTAAQAAAINWAVGHLGPAAQENLWFNPPVVLKHREGGVEIDQLHERIIEIPYAMASLALVPNGGRILDVGSNESTFPVSLAMLGYQVTALDQIRYPFTHPSLKVEVSDIQDWAGPELPLDAMFCISSIEHFGLNHYGSGHHGEALDAYTLQQARTWLRPGGVLVITVPYGLPRVTEKERIYGPGIMDHFSEGWEILNKQIYIQTAATCWTLWDGTDPEPEWTEQTRGVLMLRARRLGVEK